jgi:hypothetical protein
VRQNQAWKRRREALAAGTGGNIHNSRAATQLKPALQPSFAETETLKRRKQIPLDAQHEGAYFPADDGP